MARLTTSTRKSMPKSDFALPGKRSASGGKGGYPIENRTHARDALSRVSANGTAAEKREVRQKVARKYPGMERSQSAPSSHEAFMGMDHGDRYDHSIGRRK